MLEARNVVSAASMMRARSLGLLMVLAGWLAGCGDEEGQTDLPVEDDVDAAVTEPDAADGEPAADAAVTPDAAATWSRSFSSGVIADPAGDDTGDGDYRYPASVPAGAADLTAVSVAYDAEKGELSLAAEVAALTPYTRVAVVLMDEAGLASVEEDWCIGGVELRLPKWNGHAVTFLLAQPGSSLFDYNVYYPRGFGSPIERPDNAMYVHHDPTFWVGSSGAASGLVTDLYRLPVLVEGSRLQVKVPAALVAPFLDTTSAKVAVFAYAYLTFPDRMEFGGYEIMADQGGVAEAANSSADPDVFDVAFVDGVDADAQRAAQELLLSVPASPSGQDDAVVLREPGKGVLVLETTK